AEGMAASLRAGVAAMPANAKAMMVVLADMPELTTADFWRVINAFEISPDVPILRGAAADGTSGHPVLFPRRLFPALSRVTGDRGAREILAENRSVLRPVPLPDRHALTDLDTPEAWAEWREKTGDKA
ncbi:MAG: NTP transferase domain-containing protein, partial [Paracoccaceae bacterium]